MPYFIVTGAYYEPGERGDVDPYGWCGEANDRTEAEALCQSECHDSMCTPDEERPGNDLISVIDVWEVHPDDVENHKIHPKAFARMRAVPEA